MDKARDMRQEFTGTRQDKQGRRGEGGKGRRGEGGYDGRSRLKKLNKIVREVNIGSSRILPCDKIVDLREGDVSGGEASMGHESGILRK
jgi:hypothetical protein